MRNINPSVLATPFRQKFHQNNFLSHEKNSDQRCKEWKVHTTVQCHSQGLSQGRRSVWCQLLISCSKISIIALT